MCRPECGTGATCLNLRDLGAAEVTQCDVFKAVGCSQEVQPLLMSCVCAGWSARSPACRNMFVFHFHGQNYQ